MFCGAHLYVLQYKNYVLSYKSAYYKIITYLQERVQYSVFSFFAVVTTLCIDSILYIYKYIYII